MYDSVVDAKISGVQTPNSISMGNIGCLPYIKKYGLNPVAFE